VHGYAPFEMAAGEQAVRPQAHAADAPQLAVLRLALQDALVLEPEIELVEGDLQVSRRFGPVRVPQPLRPVRMQPLEMDRVDGVLLALEPVARDLRQHDLYEAVLPGERLPRWHQRRRLRTEVGPQQPG